MTVYLVIPCHKYRIYTVYTYIWCWLTVIKQLQHPRNTNRNPTHSVRAALEEPYIYIRCIYGIFGRETPIYTVINSAYIRFWPTLNTWHTDNLTFASIPLTCWRVHRHSIQQKLSALWPEASRVLTWLQCVQQYSIVGGQVGSKIRGACRGACGLNGGSCFLHNIQRRCKGNEIIYINIIYKHIYADTLGVRSGVSAEVHAAWMAAAVSCTIFSVSVKGI